MRIDQATRLAIGSRERWETGLRAGGTVMTNRSGSTAHSESQLRSLERCPNFPLTG